MNVFEAVDVGIRFAVPPEIPAGRVVVVKHEVRRLGRIRPGTPVDPQGCVVRIDAEDQRIERDLKFPEPTVVPDDGLDRIRLPEFLRRR